MVSSRQSIRLRGMGPSGESIVLNPQTGEKACSVESTGIPSSPRTCFGVSMTLNVTASTPIRPVAQRSDAEPPSKATRSTVPHHKRWPAMAPRGVNMAAGLRPAFPAFVTRKVRGPRTRAESAGAGARSPGTPTARRPLLRGPRRNVNVPDCVASTTRKPTGGGTYCDPERWRQIAYNQSRWIGTVGELQ